MLVLVFFKLCFCVVRVLLFLFVFVLVVFVFVYPVGLCVAECAFCLSFCYSLYNALSR